jgi:hypothetical protein
VQETTQLPATRLHHATLSNLQPNCSYLVSVTARSLLVDDGANSGALQSVNLTARTEKEAGAPWAVRALNIGPDFVGITWRHAELASAPRVSHFRLHFNATGKGHGGMKVEGRMRFKTFVSLGPSPPAAGGFVCSGMLPSSEYEVSVAACGAGGCSGTAGLTLWTAPYAPQDLAVSSISSSPTQGISMTLHWNPPCARSADGSPTRLDRKGKAAPQCLSALTSPLDMLYLVSYRRIVTGSAFGAWSSEEWSDGGGVTRTKTLGGELGADYQARLVAVYQGMRSEPVFITTKITSMPLSVESFSIAPDSQIGILASSLTLRWRPPSASAVSQYKLSWAKVSSSSLVGPYAAQGGGLGNAQSGVVEMDMRQYNQLANGSGFNYYPLTGLSQHKTYSFRIQARNFNGLGYEVGLGCLEGSDLTMSSSCITYSPVLQPSQVQHLAVRASTPSVIELEWMPPQGGESAFRDSLVFRVSRAPVVGQLTGEDVVLAPSLGLLPSGPQVIRHRDATAVDGVVYRYRVQARNKNSLGFEQGSTVLATRLTSTCVASDAACSVSNVRAVAFVGREVTDASGKGSGVGVVVEWDPPPGLFAGLVREQFYYQILASTGAQVPWGAANDQSAFGATLAGPRLDSLAPGTHRALIVNGLGDPVNKETPFSFLVRARNLNCDDSLDTTCAFPNVDAFNPLSYFGSTQGAVLSTQFRWQPSPLGQVAVKITSQSSVILSWTPIPSSLEVPLFMAKCRISDGNPVSAETNVTCLLHASALLFLELSVLFRFRAFVLACCAVPATTVSAVCVRNL